MKSIFLIYYLLTGVLMPINLKQAGPSATGSIEIKVSGLKNTKGQLGILLFSNPDGFPSDWQKSFKNILVPISGDLATYTFTDLPYGKYAISVMHDENINKKLDANMFGIPKEGYGVSNNATGTLGPPKFQDAHFMLDKSAVSVAIKLNY
jgi:uncharacterized protein (DUF2141 family)